MSCPVFVIDLIKALEHLLATPAALAIVTYLVGVHQPQPKYMQKKENDEH